MQILGREEHVLGLLSIDAKILYDRLRKCQVGEVASYQELSSLVGKNVQVDRSILATARRKCLRENRMVFGVEINVGLKLLSDVEAVRTGQDTVARLKRESKRGIRRVMAADYEKLPEDTKTLHNMFLSGLGAVAHAMEGQQQKRLEEAVKRHKNLLPIARTLDLFKQ